MSKQVQAQGAAEQAEAQLRNVVVVGRSLLRYAQQLSDQVAIQKGIGSPVEYVSLGDISEAQEDRERLERVRSQRPRHLDFLYEYADGCARIDEELRAAVNAAHAALAAAAPRIDVCTVSAEDRTTVRVRRNLRELMRRTPSPIMAGWAQVAEPSVWQGIAEALDRIVADVENLQLIATSVIGSTAAGDQPGIGAKARRQVAGQPPLEQGPKQTKLERAICMLATPGRVWSVSELADRVGCKKQTLYGSKKFMTAWNGQKAIASLRLGSKYDGQVEAVDEQDLTAEIESREFEERETARKALREPARAHRRRESGRLRT